MCENKRREGEELRQTGRSTRLRKAAIAAVIAAPGKMIEFKDHDPMRPAQALRQCNLINKTCAEQELPVRSWVADGKVLVQAVVASLSTSKRMEERVRELEQEIGVLGDELLDEGGVAWLTVNATMVEVRANGDGVTVDLRLGSMQR